MKILSIETSCDETALSIVGAGGDLESPSFSVLANSLISQINIHKQYGGVFPMLAKREHAKNLVPILSDVLKQASMFLEADSNNNKFADWQTIENLLIKEDGLFLKTKELLEKIERPEIDLIAVTNGPGLAPALWVGISFAKALGKIWRLPVIPVNHMEGHIASVLINNTAGSKRVIFPALALLISGGHTELVEIKKWSDYKIIGGTKDDAVGEAFDKVARMLKLPYPGGPEISKLAEFARTNNIAAKAKFPRPMINSKDLDFSFSGLKTSVLYYLRDNFKKDVPLTQEEKADISREFEDAVIEVILNKTLKAVKATGAETLIVGGGVIANKKLREELQRFEAENNLQVITPSNEMSTDNALMIAAAAYINICIKPELIQKPPESIIALSNLAL